MMRLVRSCLKLCFVFIVVGVCVWVLESCGGCVVSTFGASRSVNGGCAFVVLRHGVVVSSIVGILTGY